ncbi:MAG TPA: response regulator transcription factor [Flavipsychrobacter sp.]|nr:response regulator transcription factor [Flavipsychrobacter sp.]
MEENLIHIAYAEDHVAIRKSVSLYLEQLGGVKVDIEANNGAELIYFLNKAHTQPDIILLDIQMPQMNGFETLRMLKQKWPDSKALVLTAFENELYLIRMIKLGANGYLLKSCHPNEIKEALIAIHQSDYYYNDVQSKKLLNKITCGEIDLPHFSDKEREFLKYCATDLKYGEIALKMHTTVKALDGYRNRLSEKLQINGSRITFALFSIQYGFAQIAVIPAEV